MAGMTLEQAQAQLLAWLSASQAVSQGQAYSIATDSGSRSLTRAHAQEILAQIKFWELQVKRLSRGGIRVIGATPLHG